MPELKIMAFPGTQDKWDVTKYLVPGASLIFRVRGASDLDVGRPSRPSIIGRCVTRPDSKATFSCQKLCII